MTGTRGEMAMFVAAQILRDARERARTRGVREIHTHAAIVGTRGREPRDDLVRTLLATEEEGDRLTREGLLSTMLLILVAGNETTRNLIGNGMLALLRHPNQLQRLRDAPGLLESAVDELLRYNSPLQIDGRLVRGDLEMGGKRLRAGAARAPEPSSRASGSSTAHCSLSGCSMPKPRKRRHSASSARTDARSDRAAISWHGASISDGPASARRSIGSSSPSDAGAGHAGRPEPAGRASTFACPRSSNRSGWRSMSGRAGAAGSSTGPGMREACAGTGRRRQTRRRSLRRATTPAPPRNAPSHQPGGLGVAALTCRLQQVCAVLELHLQP